MGLPRSCAPTLAGDACFVRDGSVGFPSVALGCGGLWVLVAGQFRQTGQPVETSGNEGDRKDELNLSNLEWFLEWCLEWGLELCQAALEGTARQRQTQSCYRSRDPGGRMPRGKQP